MDTKSNSADVNAAAQAASNITHEFQNFLTDIEELFKATTSLTGDDLAQAKQKLKERIAVAKESVGDMGGSFMDQARKTAVNTNNYVHDEPWKAVGAGAAVGFLLGCIFSRRS